MGEITLETLSLSQFPDCVLALFPQRASKWLDSSGKGNHGTVHGATPISGRNGIGGFSFNGSSNDYVDCGNDSSLDITDAITIEAWVKTSSFGTNQYRGLVGKYSVEQTSGCRYQYGIGSNWAGGTQIRSFLHLEGYDDCYGGPTGPSINLGEWYHFVTTYDSTTGRWVLYYNGVLKAIWNFFSLSFSATKFVCSIPSGVNLEFTNPVNLLRLLKVVSPCLKM